MYTELKELVNLVARFLFSKFPRSKVGLFAEHYANALLIRFAGNWDILDTANEKKIRVFTLRNGNLLERDLLCSANATHVNEETLKKLIPDGLTIQLGPGYVAYRVNEHSPLVNVWNGVINADDNYNAIPEFVLRWQNSASGALGSTNMGIGSRGGAIFGQSNADTDNKLDIHDYVPLNLVDRPCQDPIDPCLPRSPYKSVFEYTGRNDISAIEVEQFALTRFGSQKRRPDYELMMRIQRQVSPETQTNGVRPPALFADSPAHLQFGP